MEAHFVSHSRCICQNANYTMEMSVSSRQADKVDFETHW